MTQEKMNKMLSKIMIMAILMTGLLFIGAQSTAAREDCKNVGQLKIEKVDADHPEARKARDCWVRKAKSGEKNLTGAWLTGANLSRANLAGANLRFADLTRANLTGAMVSRSTTKGVDFDDWQKRGGTVVD
jgi:serine/threonine-protein kinase